LEVHTKFVNQKNWKEMASQSNHLVKVHELWKLLRQRTSEGSYELDGQHLHIAEVVATAQYDNQRNTLWMEMLYLHVVQTEQHTLSFSRSKASPTLTE
jgi:hypothetical protein